MALDTLYRPQRYDDVVGQEHNVKVLRQFVATGKAFHQSYIFAGHYGSGKTTCARILARSMLCSNPVGGDPCDTCESCLAFLAGKSPEGYTEVDAATNSGKADVKRILEELDYSTFSGGRRVYVMDEAHQLSKDALDALLKPMEDTVYGTEEKRLVCIFCTTEPDRMRATILSRCASPLVIKVATPDQIADRLAWVATQEGITVDRDALVLIAAATDCHIRDALKTLEGVSTGGSVTRQAVLEYLHLDRNDQILDMLNATVGRDRDSVSKLIPVLTTLMSPGQIAERMSDAAVLAYQVAKLGHQPAPYWNFARLLSLGQHRDILRFAQFIADRPSRLTTAMLTCELLLWSEGLAAVQTPAPQIGFTPPAARATPAVVTPAAPVVASPPGSRLDPNMFGRGKGRGDIPPKEEKPKLSANEFQNLLKP